jgi:hypothetical protein
VERSFLRPHTLVAEGLIHCRHRIRERKEAQGSADELFFFSIHLFHPLQPLSPGQQESYEFYPGTGAADRSYLYQALSN